MGLAFLALKRFDQAARCHQDALQVAMSLNSVHGQSIAVGNLGLVAKAQGDTVTARACSEQHLNLVQKLNDASAEIVAYDHLGILANSQGEFNQAGRFFEEARELAQQTGEKGMVKLEGCRIGLAKGNMLLEQHMREVLERAVMGGRE